MTHISDEQLNEYLDRELSEHSALRIAAHLKDCPVCRRRLHSLQVVFDQLAALPQEPLAKDLAPGILARLNPQALMISGKLVYLVQGGIALAILVMLFRSENFKLAAELLHLPGKEIVLQQFLLQQWLLISNLQLPVFPLPEIAALDWKVGLNGNSVILILASTAVLWVVGNSLLLKGILRPQSGKHQVKK